MNKNEFIKDILDYSLKREVDDKTKDKLIGLVGKELDNAVLNREILKRIKKIENAVMGDRKKENEKENTISKGKKTNLPEKYIDPQNLYNFLLSYNQDPVLKYTCHEIDDEDVIKDINNKCNTEQYNIVKHQELILKAFNELTEQYEDKKISKYIYALIRTYLDGGDNKEWSSDRIKINWKSSELIEWSNKNPGVVPNMGINLINKVKNNGFEDIDSFNSGLKNERITTFSKLVIYFKYLFHIREDNQLKKLIEIQNKKNNFDEKIDFIIKDDDFWNNIELFTDVDKLIQAYKRIIEMILDFTKKSGNKPKIVLVFKEENRSVIFSIHHMNTVFGKNPNDIIKRLGEQHSNLIKNQINGLCDLYLKADFGHSTYSEINLWNGKGRKERELDEFKGVEHILKFKK